MNIAPEMIKESYSGIGHHDTHSLNSGNDNIFSNNYGIQADPLVNTYQLI